MRAHKGRVAELIVFKEEIGDELVEMCRLCGNRDEKMAKTADMARKWRGKVARKAEISMEGLHYERPGNRRRRMEQTSEGTGEIVT